MQAYVLPTQQQLFQGLPTSMVISMLTASHVMYVLNLTRWRLNGALVLRQQPIQNPLYKARRMNEQTSSTTETMMQTHQQT